MVCQPAVFDPGSGKGRNQRSAIAGGDQVHQGLQSGGLHGGLQPGLGSARSERMVDEAVAIGHDEEIASRDEEILRLRDLLITRDAELGQVRGQLKVIEDHSERMARLAAKIPLPGGAWLLDAVLRLMTARRG